MIITTIEIINVLEEEAKVVWVSIYTMESFYKQNKNFLEVIDNILTNK